MHARACGGFGLSQSTLGRSVQGVSLRVTAELEQVSRSAEATAHGLLFTAACPSLWGSRYLHCFLSSFTWRDNNWSLPAWMQAAPMKKSNLFYCCPGLCSVLEGCPKARSLSSSSGPCTWVLGFELRSALSEDSVPSFFCCWTTQCLFHTGHSAKWCRK